MDVKTAASLVSFINDNSSRFSASTIDFSERAWVLLRDSQSSRTAPCEEPILDVEAYLNRPQRNSPLNPEIQNLLEVWLRSRTEMPLPDWQNGVKANGSVL
jgi:hypothetical protein